MTRNEYNRCVDEHADGLYRFILKNLRDKEKARDIVQEAFTKVWLKKDEVDVMKSKSYLYTTAYHTMIDLIRKDERSVRLEQHHQNNEKSFNAYSDLKEVLDEALKQLPEIQRTVILLRDYEGYTYAEIGEITLLSEAQVKVYIFRARMTLKSYIQSLDKVLEVY
ncbi:MAG: RNA polymerase sigma factor [Bacteroidales bacterium]|nr:RNA polymerase sigma factor [Bacteroidales bacterium]